MSEKRLVCRCEEVSYEEIIDAIEDGARTLTGIKRRTRAGMGLCQGRTCQKLMAQILCAQTGQKPAEVRLCRDRAPVRPTTFAVLGGIDDE